MLEIENNRRGIGYIVVNNICILMELLIFSRIDQKHFDSLSIGRWKYFLHLLT